MIDCDSIDYIHLTPFHNAWDTSITHFTGDTDAQIWVYLAYGDSGVYFYFQVEDNNWLEYQVDCDNIFDCAGEELYDAIDFALEPTSPNQLTKAMCFLNNGWTKTCAQYVLRFGGQEPPIFLFFNYYNKNWNGIDSSQAINLSRGIMFNDAISQYGILNKIVPTNATDLRIQEWFIPWRAIGNPEQQPMVSCPNVGTKISAYFGYNDVDASNYDQVKELCTGNGDLTNCTVRLPNGRLDSWSTILFGPSLDSMTTAVKYKQPAQHIPVNAKIICTEYFTLNCGAWPSAITNPLRR